jgi:hypothetical protein
MNDNETTCCGLLIPMPLTHNQIERLFDNNDNEILFVNKKTGDSMNNQQIGISCAPIHLFSNRIELGNDCFLVKKISPDGKIVVLLTYVKESLILLDGNLIVNENKYNIYDFVVYTNMYIEDKIYDSIAICFYD